MDIQVTDIMAEYKERLASVTEELILAHAQIKAMQREQETTTLTPVEDGVQEHSDEHRVA